MTSPTQSSPSRSQPETIHGMAISLSFWLCLLVSACLFAVVALSPKFLSYLQLRFQFEDNQTQLVGLERQAGKLQRVIDAIRSDKDFAAELTRIELDAVRPDEEVIPVDVALKLDAREAELPPTRAQHIWYEPLVRYLASDSKLRISLLGSAALLIVISFTMLQPAAAEQVTSGVRGCNSIWRSVVHRYVRHA